MNRFKHKYTMIFLNADAGAGGGAGEPDGSTLLTGATGGEQGAGGAPGAGADTPWIGADGKFTEGWLDRIPEDLKDAKPSLSKFQSLPDLAKSYRHLEQTLGKKANATYIPDPDAKPEEIAAYRKKIGVPETPEGYKIAPEKLPEGVTWSEELVKPYAAIAHKYNIPEAALKELAAANVQQEALRLTETMGLLEAELKQGEETLKKDWGADFQKNINTATRAIQTVGGNLQSPGLRDPGVVTIIQRLAAQLSDDKLINGDVAPSLQPGKVKADDIVNNKANPYHERYWNGDKDVNKMVRDLYRESSK
jgi:hypothetical protein